MEKLKKLFKENIFYVSIIIAIFVLFNFRLPYYIMAPGGTISLEKRIETETDNEINGSLNMLYVTEYQGTIPFYLLAKVIKTWDIEKMEEQQISDETMEEIEKRNKIMLDNSLQNAFFVAYEKAEKEIEITANHNLVLATAEGYNTPLMVGDEIIEANGEDIEDVDELKTILDIKDIGDSIDLKILRNDKEKNLEVEIGEDNKIGVVILTNYEYDLDPEVEVKFKNSEGGSSGGLMLTLSIYQLLVDEDIVKGRKIAGTGTIDKEGNVGEIDGIKYKIMGAHKKRMDIVLVPEANYKEAIKVNDKYGYNLEIVSIKTFDDALNYLKKGKK